MGSGGGRNSVFMAQLGNSVDSVDIVNLRFLDKLPNNLNKLIRFHHESVDNFVIEKDKYNMIILTRLIQYLGDDSLTSLIKRCSNGLKKGGVLLLSYSYLGGIKERFDVEFYRHEIEKVKQIIEKEGLKTVYLQEGSKVSTSVPYSANIKSYDIIAQKQAG